MPPEEALPAGGHLRRRGRILWTTPTPPCDAARLLAGHVQVPLAGGVVCDDEEERGVRHVREQVRVLLHLWLPREEDGGKAEAFASVRRLQ